MSKYKQKIIPEVSSAAWRELTLHDLRKKANEEYRHLLGKKVKNLSLGITVEFESAGARKTSHGGALYSRKACLVTILDQLIEHAEYNNWGDRKDSDPDYIIGFLNFNVKVRIDGKLEKVHLIIRVRNDGKFHYSLEVNKKPAG